jgi:hypothetical protein
MLYAARAASLTQLQAAFDYYDRIMALCGNFIIAPKDKNNCGLYWKSVPGVDSLISKSASVIPAEAVILSSYSYSMKNIQQPPFLFDTGSDVHITPKEDFEPGTLVKLYGRLPKIMTGGGPVYATFMGVTAPAWTLLLVT